MILLLMLGLTTTAAAERIAVLDLKPVGADPTLAQAVSENLRTMIIQSGRYQVVERSQLNGILDEYSLEQSGLTEEGDARAVGSLANVDVVLLGSLSQLFETYSINARIIDVASGVVQKALKVDMASHAEFPRKIDELALSIGGGSEQLTIQEEPSLDGIYQAQGDDYVGRIGIRKSGDIYLMTWEIDNSQTGEAPQSFTGWGLLHGGVLSSHYRCSKTRDNFGVAAYEVLLAGKQLRGLYTNLGTAAEYGRVRFENAVKQER